MSSTPMQTAPTRFAKMGKPSNASRANDEDARSSHTSQSIGAFTDDDAPELDINDLPPLYDDAVLGSSSSNAPLLPLASSTNRPDLITPFSKSDTTACYLSASLASDPQLLERNILAWAAVPPRAYVRLIGTHSRRERKSDGKSYETRTVTDFDVRVEVTPHLFGDAGRPQTAWQALRTPEDHEEVRRGTVLRKARKRERAWAGAPPADLKTWCHLFCASGAGLRCFVLERNVLGFDFERVREKLEGMVRATNYQGRLSVSWEARDGRVEVYNACRTNEWRLTSWIWWLCALSFLWVFTWPYLFFCTKRFEVAFAEWHFSRWTTDGRREFVSLSEDQWYNLWARAVSRAVLSRRQCTLDQEDLRQAGGADGVVFANPMLEGAAETLRAGVYALNEANRHLGWGYDD